MQAEPSPHFIPLKFQPAHIGIIFAAHIVDDWIIVIKLFQRQFFVLFTCHNNLLSAYLCYLGHLSADAAQTTQA